MMCQLILLLIGGLQLTFPFLFVLFFSSSYARVSLKGEGEQEILGGQVITSATLFHQITS